MSYFQALPDLISSKIFELFLNNLAKDSSYFDLGNIKLFSPLLWSCSSWRYITLYYMFEKQEVQIGNGNIERGYSNWPKNLDMPLTLTASLAKILTIHVSFPITKASEGILFDKALGNLLSSMIFTNARLMILYMLIPTSYQVDFGVDILAFKNFDSLIGYLKRLAPNVCDLDVQSTHPKDTTYCIQLPALYSELVKSLVVNIAKRKLTINAMKGQRYIDLTNLGNIGPLTYIRLNGWNGTWMFKLISRCAETLQVLEFYECLSSSNLTYVVEDSDDNYVIFPSVMKLVIKGSSSEFLDAFFGLDPSIVAFPNLQYFSCSDGYNFSDEMVFRGNQGALKELDINLDRSTVGILLHSGVFTDTSHFNLQRVKIRQNEWLYRYFSYYDLAELVYNIGKNAVDLTLEVKHYGYFKSQHFTLSRLLGQHKLQKLCIDQFELGISDIILILESLPNLVDFSTCFESMEIPDVPVYHNRHLQQLIDQHYILAPNLRTLGVLSKNNTLQPRSEVAMLAILVLCPNICVLKVEDISMTTVLQQSLDRFLFMKGYRDYAARFEALKIIRFYR